MTRTRPVLVLVMDGIGTASTATKTSNVLDPAVDTIMNGLTNATRELVLWPASYGPVGDGSSWSQSADIGVINAAGIISRYPDHDIVIMAYSGGNMIAKRLLEARPDLHVRVVAMGRLSDPWRPRSRWQNGTPDPGGWGVCGEDLGPISNRTYWSSAPAIAKWLNPPAKRGRTAIHRDVRADPISSASERSLMRPFADGTDYLGSDIDAFFADLKNMTSKNNVQILAELALLRQNPFAYMMGLGARISITYEEVLAYSTYRQHTTAYTEEFRTTDGGAQSLSERLGATVLHKTNRRLPR